MKVLRLFPCCTFLWVFSAAAFAQGFAPSRPPVVVGQGTRITESLQFDIDSKWSLETGGHLPTNPTDTLAHHTTETWSAAIVVHVLSTANDGKAEQVKLDVPLFTHTLTRDNVQQTSPSLPDLNGSFTITHASGDSASVVVNGSNASPNAISTVKTLWGSIVDVVNGAEQVGSGPIQPGQRIAVSGATLNAWLGGISNDGGALNATLNTIANAPVVTASFDCELAATSPKPGFPNKLEGTLSLAQDLSDIRLNMKGNTTVKQPATYKGGDEAEHQLGSIIATADVSLLVTRTITPEP